MADHDPLTALADLGSISDHIDEVDDRVSLLKRRIDRAQRDVLIAVAGVALALILLLIAGLLLLDQHAELGQLQARQVAADTHRTRVDITQRDATCTLINGLQGTYTTAVRDSWPHGPNDYDHLYVLLRDASSTLRCGAK